MIEPISQRYRDGDIAMEGFNINLLGGMKQIYFKQDSQTDYVIEIYDDGRYRTTFNLKDGETRNAGFGFYNGKTGFAEVSREQFLDYLQSSSHVTLDWFLFNLDILTKETL